MLQLGRESCHPDKTLRFIPEGFFISANAISSIVEFVFLFTSFNHAASSLPECFRQAVPAKYFGSSLVK
jgi:NADH:ubiquinone oxidoreductase subunit F (NADH-binding)